MNLLEKLKDWFQKDKKTFIEAWNNEFSHIFNVNTYSAASIKYHQDLSWEICQMQQQISSLEDEIRNLKK